MFSASVDENGHRISILQVKKKSFQSGKFQLSWNIKIDNSECNELP